MPSLPCWSGGWGGVTSGSTAWGVRLPAPFPEEAGLSGVTSSLNAGYVSPVNHLRLDVPLTRFTANSMSDGDGTRSRPHFRRA